MAAGVREVRPDQPLHQMVVSSVFLTDRAEPIPINTLRTQSILSDEPSRHESAADGIGRAFVSRAVIRTGAEKSCLRIHPGRRRPTGVVLFVHHLYDILDISLLWSVALGKPFVAGTQVYVETIDI